MKKILLSALLTIIGLGISLTKAQTFTFSETFTGATTYCKGTPQYDNWQTMRTQLDTNVKKFVSVKFYGSNDPTGVTCTDKTQVRLMAQQIKNWTSTSGTTTYSCGGIVWSIGNCGGGCGTGSSANDGVEFTAAAGASTCGCSTTGTYTLRPAIANTNWGGITGSSGLTCGAATQTLSVTFTFQTAPIDASAEAVVSPTNVCGGTSEPFIVRVTNSGTSAIASGMTVGGSVSGGLSGTYSKALSRSIPVSGSDTIHLGNLNTSSATGTINFVAWTALTNDTVLLNDTFKTTLSILNNPISGTKTVGPTGDYSNLTAAAAAVKSRGISGSILFELQPGYSSSSETYPLNFSDYKNVCVSGTTRITIRPQSGASNLVINSNDATSTFILDGVKYFTIDGRPGGTGTSRELHILNTSTTGSVFRLINDAIANKIMYCNIRSANTNSASGAIFLGASTKLFGIDSLLISNNLISRTSATATLASAITSSPNSSVLIQNDNITITENEIHSWLNFGINVVSSLGNGEKWTITKNSFYDSIGTTSTSWTAISFIPGTTSLSVANIISENFIGGSSSNCGGTPLLNNSTSATMGGIRITCNPGTPTLVQNNVIQNISFTNTTQTATFMGINPAGGSMIIGGAAGKGNLIGDEGTPNSIYSLGNNPMIGISSSSANDMVFSYNVIANIAQSNTGTSAGIRGIVNTGGTSVYITNNTVKSLTTNSNNSGGITGATNSITGIFSSAAANNQYIMDNMIGGGTSEALMNNSTTGLPTILGIGASSGITLIKRNKINGIINTAPSAGTATVATIVGIYKAGTAGNLIEENEIQNLSATSSAAATQINGMYITSASDINNNIIRGLSTAGINTGTGSTAALTGISFQTALPATIRNNTIENFNASAATTTEIVGITTASTLTYVQNNIIRHFSSNSTSTTATLASILGIAITPSTINKNVTGNKIYGLYNYNTTAAATVTGIYMTNTTSFGNNSMVNNNFIHSFMLATSGVGVLTGIYAGTGIVTYQNNMIRLGTDTSGNTISGPYNIRGIVHASASSSNFYNNSVYLAGTSTGTTSTACMEFLSTITTTETVNLKNNIFYNNISNTSTGRNACIKIISVNGRIFSNHNILYAPNTGGAAGAVGSTSYTSLTGSGGWNSIFLMDGQSGSVDPNFIAPSGSSSSVNLHLGSSNPAESAGDPNLTSVLTDFDGQPRTDFTLNDIGADAGTFTKSNDKFPPIINLVPLTNTSSTADRSFLVNIIDNGIGMPLTSANAPKVYYKKGSGTVYSGAGALVSGSLQNGSWNFTINATTLGGIATGDIISYYIVAQDSSANLVSNAMYAIASDVNSVTTHPVIQNTYTIVTSLATSINVGTGQTYTSLTETGAAGLFNAINNSGLQGNTIVNITSDMTETGAIALNQWNETGSGNYTLTIRPSAASRRVLSGTASPTGGLIRFNGADRVKLTGIPSGGSTSDTFLFIKSTSSSVATLTLMSDAMDNTIENCVIEASPTIGVNVGAIVISPTALVRGNDNNTFIRCYIRSINGTGLPVGIHSSGTAPSGILPIILNDNITIQDCKFYNFTTNGISVTATGNGDNWNILNNHFYWTSSTTAATAQTAINFIPGITSNNNTISGNFIGGKEPNCGGAAWNNSALSAFNGIMITAGTELGTQVQNNTIKNLLFSNTGTLATLFTGINITGGVVDVGGTTGNVIGDPNAANSIQTNGDAGLIGINSTTAFRLTVNNNTVSNLTATGGSVYTSTAVRGITITSGTLTLNVNNNTVKNLTATSRSTGSSTGAAVVGIGVGSSGNFQNILNNTVQNLKNLDNVGAHCMVGIYTTSGLNKVKGNTITGLVSSAANTNSNSAATGILGMLMQSNLGNSEYSNNKISDLQYVSSSPTTFQMIGLLINTGSGIKATNNTISSMNSMSISANTLSSAAMIGLSFSGSGTYMDISQNTIHSLNHNNSSTSNAVNVIGLYFSGSTVITPSTITRNLIHSLKLSTSGAGSIYGIFNNAGTSTVENNMVRVGIDSSGNAFAGPYNVHGIYQNFSNVNCMYFHNSVYTGGTPSSGSSITSAFSIALTYATNTTRAIVRNNIFYNAVSNTGSATGKNYAMKLLSSAFIYSNHNILLANGTGGYTGGTAVDYANLSGASSWQSGTGLDLNSGSGDPAFINATGNAGAVNLHLASSNPEEGNGTIDVTTTLDFDGTLRSSMTPVDIGAHAGNFTLSSDIFAPVITFNPLNNASTTSGSRVVNNVSIMDNAGIPMTGSSIPRIYFSKDSVNWYSSPATSMTGTSKNALASFAINYSTMGGVSLGDTILYYIIAQDNAGNIRSNSLYAVATDVNTITTHATPLMYKLVPALAAGTKLKVGTGKTYTSLTGTGGLFEYLNTVSLGGDVTAVITSNTSEPGTFALNQLGDNGDGSFTLTIRPDSLTTTERLISGNAGTGMIRLDGADRVKFTGIPDFNGISTDKKIRFRNSASGGQVFLFVNEAIDNRLHNLIIESANASASGGVIQFNTSNKASGNSRDTVSGCLIEHDKTGVLPLGVAANAIYSVGDVGKENTANVISGNEITNFSQYGVWLSSIGNGHNWIIEGNSFYRNLPFPAFAIQYAIFIDVQLHSGGHKITNNSIGGAAKNCGGAPWINNANVDFRGISVTTASLTNPIDIKNNVVQNIRRPNIATTSIFSGIIVQGAASSNIENNLVGHPTDINSIVLSGAGQMNGISPQSNGVHNIIGNTVQGINLNTPGVASTFVGIFSSNGFCTVRNNLVGSKTVANSIQHSGTASNIGIQTQMTSLNAPTVLVDNNTIANMTSTGYESAIILRGYLHTGTAIPTITNNTLYNLSVYCSNITIIPPTAVSGIGISGSVMGGTISNNLVHNIMALNTGTVATSAVGIGLTTANNVVISNNRIYDIINLSTNTNINAPATAVGISISSPQNGVIIQNNQISLGTGQTNSPMFIGIWQSASGNFMVNSYFNSIFIGGTASSGTHPSFGYLRGNNYVTSGFISIVNAKNNIFLNDRKGGTGMHYAMGNQNIIASFQTGWQANASNYNLLSNSSAYPMGLWNISDYNFSDWKSNSNSDLNSVFVTSGTSGGQLNPANLFQNLAMGNLSLIRSNTEVLFVHGKGTPISGITTDFDNLMRNATTPTIGSSETFNKDMGITEITSPSGNTCGKAATTVTVTIKNFGLESQSNIPVTLVGSGDATFSFSEVVPGPIASFASASYTFTGTFNSKTGGTYLLRAYTNLTGDGIRANDSSALTPINLNPLPKPSFTHSDTCAGSTTMFTSTSTVTGGSITANSWQFGDGTTASGNTVSHVYSTTGVSYSAKVISTSNNGCVDSASKSLFILSNLLAGSVGNDQTICYNTQPSLLTNVTSASGSKGPYVYQWQSSADNVTFTNISGANGLDYQPGNLTTTVYYRRAVTTTSGCGPSNSNSVKITANPIVTGGVIGSAQTICYNGTGAALTFSSNPTGGFGTYTYQWQQSPDSATWSNITGQTGTSFTPSNVTVITYYRALVTSGSCPSEGSNGVKIKLFSPITGGTIGSGQVICAGTAPAGFTQVSAPSGGPGTYTFQWQSSTDSINWNNISGATSANYTSGSILTVTYFQRLAGSTGCPSGTSNALKVRTLPKPNVVFNASNHCYNDQMPLTNTSSIVSGTLSYLWKFGDGTTSTSSVPNKTYSSSGTYNVTLTATSNLGCKDSSVKSVVVATQPIPAYTFTPKCQGDSVIFTDQTVYACGATSGLVYLWNFGDGTTSNAQHARHHYSSPGTYNVKFKLSLPGGYKDSVTKVVVFNIRSIPNFTATNNCFPLATNFTNSSSNFSTLAWSFGDGSSSTTTASSFSKTYVSAATYNAKLVSTSAFGCKDSLIKQVQVFSKPSASFSTSNNCVGKVTSFSNSSSGSTSYIWDFGDGNNSTAVNPSHTFASSGTYAVKLKVVSSNGCLDSTTNSVTIYPNPTAGFTTANVCLGFASVFTNTSTGASTYNWNFGNGNTSTATNPTYSYPTAGNYTVTLTSTTSNGCTQSTSSSYTVYGSPTANFTGANVCIGTSVTFNNTSTGAASNSWNFGDGTSSSSVNPSKAYSASGNFNVKLTVTNVFGCKDSITKSITIFAKPVAAFTAANQCFGNAVNFTNQSTGSVSNLWSFGDGKSSAATSPTYTYASAGTYNVKLGVSTSNGCKDSITKSITVYPKPSVSFTASPDPICRGGIMSFTNNTVNGSSYTWTFGNGATSTATSPTNIYNTAGNYNVKLVSSSTNGCKDSTFKTVTVWPRPVASFKVNDGCATDNLAFGSNSVGAVTHAWTFGDGNTSTAANPSKGYVSAGTYNVRLIVTSINGCLDTTASNVTVHPRASVSFTNPGSFCAGTSATFTNTSSLSAGTMTFQWKFGDGNSSSTTSPVNTYVLGGNYIVTLTANTDKGCINTVTSNVIVYSKPKANFNANSMCQGQAVTFNNTSTGASSYAWDFGDASTSTSASPTHSYSAGGTFNVTLSVTNTNNCTDIYTRTLTIHSNPVATFNAVDRCVGLPTVFTNTSTGVTDVFWQFGDGGSSNSANPAYTYSKYGTYNVTLNVESANGCQASASKAVNVYPEPTAAFSVNDNEQCVNVNSFVYTDNSSIPVGSLNRAWSFGDGSTSSSVNPTKTYTSAGSYNVKLVVTSTNGCKDSSSAPVMVAPKPLANFNINNNAQCFNGHLFSYTDASTISNGLLNHTWNLGDGNMAGGTNVIKKYAAIGTYDITLSVVSDFGCSDNITKTVTINPSPSASFTTNDDIQCLNGNTFNFVNTTSGAALFSSIWKLGDGSTIVTTNASRTYAAAGNYKVTLNVNTPFGCRDSAYYTMKVMANPGNISITGPTVAANGSSPVYSVPFNAGSSYNWMAVNGSVLSNGSNTIQIRWNPSGATGNVTVTETGANGCLGNPATMNVTLNDPASVGNIHRNAFAASLYPNPSKNSFTVEVGTGEMVNLVVYDQLGRAVMEGIRFNNTIIITDHELAAGLYTLRLTTDKGKVTILRFETIK